MPVLGETLYKYTAVDTPLATSSHLENILLCRLGSYLTREMSFIYSFIILSRL